jgi:RimJ/RimL family protein N-acetyltransferase
MIEISRAQLEMLTPWFQPEEPGPVIGPHLIRTGTGRAWTDRWPDVRAIVVETSYNYTMVGDPSALDCVALADNVAGFVAAPPHFLPMLEVTFPTLERWPRIIGVLPAAPITHSTSSIPHVAVRRFAPQAADDLEMLSAESIWVTQTWGGGKALAQSGYGWGAWVDGVLASVACTFFLGNDYEDIGVATEPGFRNMGLSTACVYELCLDVIARGRKPSWTTSMDNASSWRVAEKVGFVHQRNSWLYVVNRRIPKANP